MSSESDLFSFNFTDEIGILQSSCRNIGKRELNDLHKIFKSTDDGLFAFMCSCDFKGYEAIKAVIPSWASDEIRRDSTGAFSFYEHVLDASWFWRTIRQEYEALTGREVRQARVVDYGAGWGRITRFVNKDVPAHQLFALEPNPVFCQIFEECRVPGKLVPTDWLSTRCGGTTDIDLIFSYSILTHSSDRLTKNVVDRWTEMTKPGSILAFTIRPGSFLAERSGEMAIFTDDEHCQLKSIYRGGEIAYKPYEGYEDWGVAIIPEAYLRKIFDNRFRIVKRAYQLQTSNQLIIIAERI